MDNVDFYVFPRVVTFVVIPNSGSGCPPPRTRLSEAELKRVQKILTINHVPLSEHDRLADEQMQNQHSLQFQFPFFAEVVHLTPTSKVSWNASRGWFDDLVRVVDWRKKDNRDWWMAPEDSQDWSSSYRGLDVDCWDDVQEERPTCITLRQDLDELEVIDSEISDLEVHGISVPFLRQEKEHWPSASMRQDAEGEYLFYL